MFHASSTFDVFTIACYSIVQQKKCLRVCQLAEIFQRLNLNKNAFQPIYSLKKINYLYPRMLNVYFSFRYIFIICLFITFVT